MELLGVRNKVQSIRKYFYFTYFFLRASIAKYIKEIGSFGQFKSNLRVELLGRYTFETD